MVGETDLPILLRHLEPVLNAGEFVFCRVDSADGLDPLGVFRETEGLTVILSKGRAEELGLARSSAFAWITLSVHSSLDAVGLTAAVSRALTEAGISCNVVAAFHHDHLFVPVSDAARAMEVLLGLP